MLFPSFTPASEILTELRRRIAERGIEVMTRTEARGFSREGVQLPDGRMLACDSVVVCSGFTLFDASIKEEYGYGIYDNVFTTVDIERMLNEGRVARADGSRPSASPSCTAWARATRRFASSIARRYAASRG